MAELETAIVASVATVGLTFVSTYIKDRVGVRERRADKIIDDNLSRRRTAFSEIDAMLFDLSRSPLTSMDAVYEVFEDPDVDRDSDRPAWVESMTKKHGLWMDVDTELALTELLTLVMAGEKLFSDAFSTLNVVTPPPQTETARVRGELARSHESVLAGIRRVRTAMRTALGVDLLDEQIRRRS